MSYQIARDGDTLGTFTEEELVEAVEQGTILITDLAWTEGMEEWEPVETLIEIEEEEVEEPAAGSAPPQAVAPEPEAAPVVRRLGQQQATTHYTAPPSAPTVVPARYGAPPPQMARGHTYASIPPGYYGPAGSAIASLVLGILSLVLLFFTGIPAIICGHMARGKIRRTAGAFSGHGMAVAGIVLGYVMSVLGVLLIIWSFAIKSLISRVPDVQFQPPPPPIPSLQPPPQQ